MDNKRFKYIFEGKELQLIDKLAEKHECSRGEAVRILIHRERDGVYVELPDEAIFLPSQLDELCKQLRRKLAFDSNNGYRKVD